MELKSSSISILVLICVSFTFSPVHCIINQGCLGVPKDESGSIRCYLEPEDPLTSPSTRVDCSLNFKPEDKVRFQCEKLYKPVGLTAREEEQQEEQEILNGGDFWRFSKCVGMDEWDRLNYTVSLANFRCELDKGHFDQNDNSALISGGVEVAVKSMPWMAAIFQDGKFSCGGTLIDKTFVLTAAHCTDLDASAAIGTIPPETLIVVLGSSSGIFSQAMDPKLNPNAQVFNVIDIASHRNYSRAPSYHNDIAILQLEKEIKLTKYVLPVEFPRKIQINSIEKGGFVLQVNGFGIFSNETSSSSSKLLATNLTTTNFQYCQQFERRFDQARQFCGVPTSGDQRYSGICKGDSGSGAFIKDGRIGRERWSIQGLVSFGASKVFDGCYNVTFFTKVEFFKPWIEEEKTRLKHNIGKPPNVEISYERGKVSLINNTFTISKPLRNWGVVTHDVFITCSAHYPIKFVYKDDPFEQAKRMILQNDQNYVTYTDFYKPFTYIFKIRAKFGFHRYISDLSFTCESIDGPKKRQLIEFSEEQTKEGILKDEADLIYKLSPSVQGKGQKKENSTVRVSDEPCKAFFYYEEVKDDKLGFPTYAFHCQRADGTPGNLKQISCPTRAKCRNYFDDIRRSPKNCWRKVNNRNSTETAQNAVVTEFNFLSFIPFCLWSTESGEDSEISLPVFYSVPKGFKSQPDIFFEGLREADKAPPLFGNFSDLPSKQQQSMIHIKNFGLRHLNNSIVQVVCQASHYWTANSFQFAVQLANETKLRLLPVEVTTDYDATLNANIQVARVNLKDTRIERIWCFAGIENTHQWLNASRPIRIFQSEWDLLEANRQCSVVQSQKQETVVQALNKTIVGPPELEVRIEHSGLIEFNELKNGEPIIVSHFPHLGKVVYLKCKASYPIRMVQLIHNETDYRVNEIVYVNNFVNATNYTDHNYEVLGYFYHGTSGQGRVMRCESRDDPKIQSSLEYSYSEKEQQLIVTPVDELETNSTAALEDCEQSENEIENKSECEAVFYFEKQKEFPHFGFRCEFPFGQVGEVKIHPCDSPSHCLNLYRDRRQSQKCWKKSYGCSTKENPCPGLTKIPYCQGKDCGQLIIPATHRPFVATCSRGTPGQPDFEETTWGSFAYFADICMDDDGNGTAAKLYFGDWSEAEKEQVSLIYMKAFPEQQTLGNTISVNCRVSKFYAYSLVVFAVELRQGNQEKVLEVKDMSYYGSVLRKGADDKVHYWSKTAKIKLDNNEIERIYCFGRSATDLQWFNASRPVYIENPS